MFSLLFCSALSANANVPWGSSQYRIYKNAPTNFVFPNFGIKTYAIFLNSDDFVTSEGSPLLTIYTNPSSLTVSPRLLSSALCYIQLVQLNPDCTTVDFVLNYYQSPVQINYDKMQNYASHCIIFTSASFMNYEFYKYNLYSSDYVAVWNSYDTTSNAQSFNYYSNSFTITMSKCCIFKLSTSSTYHTGYVGLSSMSYYSGSPSSTEKLLSGMFYVSTSPNIFTDSLQADFIPEDPGSGEITLKVLPHGSQNIIFKSGTSYLVNKSNLIVFHPFVGQKDVVVTAICGDVSKTILGNTDTYAVYFENSGFIMINTSLSQSSIYLTVFSNTDSKKCEKDIVVVGNISTIATSNNFPSQFDSIISERLVSGKYVCFYVAFVQSLCNLSYSTFGSVTVDVRDTNERYLYTYVNSMNYPVKFYAYQSSDNEIGFLNITATNRNYPFFRGVLTDRSSGKNFIYISNNSNKKKIAAIVGGVVGGVVFIIILIVIICCCCKKKSNSERTQASISSELSSDDPRIVVHSSNNNNHISPPQYSPPPSMNGAIPPSSPNMQDANLVLNPYNNIDPN